MEGRVRGDSIAENAGCSEDRDCQGRINLWTELMFLRHDGKMVRNAMVLVGPNVQGSCSSQSFFGGYDLPRNEVTSAG